MEYKSHKAQKTLELEARIADTIRIPIIKFVLKIDPSDEKKIFKADIAVNNVLGVANSSLLNIYSEIDKRCKIMGLILKHWAKKWKITNEESLSSYALILMMIYYLQLKKILPSLQRIAKEKRIKKNSEKAIMKIKRTVRNQLTEEFETNFEFEKDLVEISKYMKKKGFGENKQNLLELLLEFFYFYSDKGAFRKFHMKCNIKKGETDFKNTFNKDYDREINYYFSIKDPFDKMHNPGDRVRKSEKIREITHKIDSTIQTLEDENWEIGKYKNFYDASFH